MSEETGYEANAFEAGEIWVDPGPPRMFAPADSKTLVAMLGSGAVMPNPYRNGPGGAIIVEDTPYIIDAGEAIWRSIAKAATAHDGRLVNALHPHKMTRLFITHLHSDHTVGLANLLLMPWTLAKADPLEIYGPLGTKHLVTTLLDAYRADIEERTKGPERKNPTGWMANVHEFSEPGLVYEDNRVKVEAFHHVHGTWAQNFGYRFTTEERVIVWAGDGHISDSFSDAAQGADIVLSELCTDENLANAVWGGVTPEEKEEIIWAYHLKPLELAELAMEANVRQLVLMHELNYSNPFDPEALLEEIKRVYAGEVISSRDSDIY